MRSTVVSVCPYCEECKGEATLRCAKCHVVDYCSRDCQKKNWPRHKERCQPHNLPLFDIDIVNAARKLATRTDLPHIELGSDKFVWSILTPEIVLASPTRTPSTSLAVEEVVDGALLDHMSGFYRTVHDRGDSTIFLYAYLVDMARVVGHIQLFPDRTFRTFLYHRLLAFPVHTLPPVLRPDARQEGDDFLYAVAKYGPKENGHIEPQIVLNAALERLKKQDHGDATK